MIIALAAPKDEEAKALLSEGIELDRISQENFAVARATHLARLVVRDSGAIPEFGF
jgi:hypothetical protein